MNTKVHQPEKPTNDIQQKQSPEASFYMIGFCLLSAAVPAVILYRYLREHFLMFWLPCAFHALTGYYCPGCGGTRSIHALLSGHLWTAFCYHPLVPYTAAIYSWFMISQTIERLSKGHIPIGMQVRTGWLWSALAILFLNVIIKNVFLLSGIDLLQMLPD